MIHLNITSSLYILFLLHIFCAGTSGESVKDVHVDGSKLERPEPSDSPNRSTVSPMVTNFTNIMAISNTIKIFQKKLEKEHKYLPVTQAYLMSSTAVDRIDQNFRFLALILKFFSAKRVVYKYNAANKTAETQKMVNCTNVAPLNLTDISAEIVNTTRLGSILESDPEVRYPRSPGICTLVFFYTKSCRFSILAAPHFNVLPRIFPQIKMAAFNALSDQRVNSMFGVTGVPTLILFHNGKFFMKYNGSDYSLYEYTKFVMRHTDLAPNEKVEISVTDFVKPVAGYKTSDIHYALWLAWLATLFWTRHYIRHTRFWKRFLEKVYTWYNDETQHEHAD